ncbi:MAG: hypothetical protein NTY93_00970 [Candidatus Kaiserbacteria bacterium]|nr:hypothetical protein [Candidatus Kaiserbacteria bacterium]
MKIATLAIITRGNKILLGLKRNGCEIGDGTLNGPGGKQEPCETLVECLMRVRGEKFNANVYYRERAKGFLKIEFLPFID